VACELSAGMRAKKVYCISSSVLQFFSRSISPLVWEITEKHGVFYPTLFHQKIPVHVKNYGDYQNGPGANVMKLFLSVIYGFPC
jgi:hypothetical protein